MQVITTLGFLAALAASVTANPALVTPTPVKVRASSCASIVTTTHYEAHACPDFCVVPGSPICTEEAVACPARPVTCPSPATWSTEYIGPPTTIISTTTVGCTATVEAEVGCQICGCPRPSCVLCVDGSSIIP